MASFRDRLASQASMEANRLRERIGDLEAMQVPIFNIVRSLQIWLMTQPMDWSLYGFSLIEGDVRGICINAQHPEPMQRFTCAHELGHLVLGHKTNIDHSVNVDSASGSPQELQAQSFASTFMMPVANVYRGLKVIGTSEGQLSPSDAYRLARILDVSFAALCWRLVEMEIIGRDLARRWIRSGPAAARRAIADEVVTSDLTILYGDARAHGRVGDKVVVDIQDHADSGYEWRPVGSREPSSRVRWDGSADVSSLLEAYEGSSLLSLTAAGEEDITIELVRPWEHRDAIETRSITVEVAPEHSIELLDETQRIALRQRASS